MVRAIFIEILPVNDIYFITEYGNLSLVPEQLEMEWTKKMKVRNIKKHIEDETGKLVQTQRLFYIGHELHNDIVLDLVNFRYGKVSNPSVLIILWKFP